MSECNKVITIGYLKQFVEGSGVVVNDGGFPNSYCLSFKQLTGNSFVQKGSISSLSPKDDIDGIIVNSNYNDNQLVNQRDISLVYTSFGELRISSDKTTIPTSGGNATLSITYTYTRKTKTMKSDCSSYETITTNANGNCNEITFHKTLADTASSISNCTNYSIGENSSPEGHANSRTDSIYATINFRGSTHTSNTITIIQDALTGSFIGDATTGEVITSLIANATTSTVFNTCTGDTYGAVCKEKYYVTRNWVDNTGRQYPSITGKSDVSGESNLEKTYSSVTRTFSAVGCPTVDCNTGDTIQFSDGSSIVSNSITFTRTASNQCGSCEDSVEYGSTSATVNNVDMCGGSITVQASVPGTIHNKGWVGGVCTETGTTPTSSTQSITVSIGENNTSSAKQYTGSETTSQGGTINYTIYQLAGPCGGCTGANTTYSFEPKTVSCNGENGVQVVYTATTTYGNCPPKQETGYTNPEDISCNDLSTSISHRYIFEGASYIIEQEAGPCCPIECGCDDLNIETNVLEFGWNETANTKTASIDCGGCSTGINAQLTAGGNYFEIMSKSCSGIVVKASNENTGGSALEGTIKVTSTQCPAGKTFTVRQNGRSCPQNSAITDYSTATYDGIVPRAGANVTVGWTYEVTTTSTTCSVTTDTYTAYSSITISRSDTCSSNPTVEVRGSFSWSGKTIEYVVNQVPLDPESDECKTCSCDKLTVSPTSLTWDDCNDTSSKEVTYTYGMSYCISDVLALSSSYFNVVSITPSANGGTIVIEPKSKNLSSSPITDTINVTYNYNNNGTPTPCTAIPISLTHNSGATCICGTFTADTGTTNFGVQASSATYNWGVTTDSSAIDGIKVVVPTSHTGWCSVTTSSTQFTVDVTRNTTNSPRSATLEIYGMYGGTQCSTAYGSIIINQACCPTYTIKAYDNDGEEIPNKEIDCGGGIVTFTATPNP